MKEKKPLGRPSGFKQEIADDICERIADGESLRAICSEEEMPNKSTVLKWLIKNPDFASQYALAREEQAEALFDEVIDIADDGRNDWMAKQTPDGDNVGWLENGEAIRRSQMRIDARKWMAGKLKPKKYGDKLDLNHTGAIQQVSDEVLDARLAVLLGKTGIGSPAGGEGKT